VTETLLTLLLLNPQKKKKKLKKLVKTTYWLCLVKKCNLKVIIRKIDMI
jgi:hypothetical protein